VAVFHLFSSEDASPSSSEFIIPVAMIDIYFYTHFTSICTFRSRKYLIMRTLQMRVLLSPTALKTGFRNVLEPVFVFGGFPDFPNMV
jgi:hypothetical protein